MVISVVMWPTLGAKVDSVEQAPPQIETPAMVEQAPVAAPIPDPTPESRPDLIPYRPTRQP